MNKLIQIIINKSHLKEKKKNYNVQLAEFDYTTLTTTSQLTESTNDELYGEMKS